MPSLAVSSREVADRRFTESLATRRLRQMEETRQRRDQEYMLRLQQQMHELTLRQAQLQPLTFSVPPVEIDIAPPLPSAAAELQEAIIRELGQPIRPQPNTGYRLSPEDLLRYSPLRGSGHDRSRLVGSGDLAMISSAAELLDLAHNIARHLQTMGDDETANELEAIREMNEVLYSLIIRTGEVVTVDLPTPAVLEPVKEVAADSEPVFRRMSSSERVRRRLIA